MKIAIQGIKGSYHDVAVQKHFGQDVELLECDSFRQIFKHLKQGEADYGVLAIENSLVGSILPNYALLRESMYRIIGEVYLRITHHLLASHKQDISEIDEVRSHPMALRQCAEFFLDHPHIKLVEDVDTAASARDLAARPTAGKAVIASAQAANIYQMETLAKGIETYADNFTRFLVIAQKGTNGQVNYSKGKASICFNLAHEKGLLAKVLTIIANHDINLSKVQSMPMKEKAWEYFFYLDMEFSDQEKLRSAIHKIKPFANQLKILGIYPCAEVKPI
ncbi:MAG: prephenate dehydratase domain-containing protein [Bacteroidota bacterium]